MDAANRCVLFICCIYTARGRMCRDIGGPAQNKYNFNIHTPNLKI